MIAVADNMKMNETGYVEAASRFKAQPNRQTKLQGNIYSASSAFICFLLNT
jgi:hypothetical protein